MKDSSSWMGNRIVLILAHICPSLAAAIACALVLGIFSPPKAFAQESFDFRLMDSQGLGRVATDISVGKIQLNKIQDFQKNAFGVFTALYEINFWNSLGEQKRLEICNFIAGEKELRDAMIDFAFDSGHPLQGKIFRILGQASAITTDSKGREAIVDGILKEMLTHPSSQTAKFMTALKIQRNSFWRDGITASDAERVTKILERQPSFESITATIEIFKKSKDHSVLKKSLELIIRVAPELPERVSTTEISQIMIDLTEALAVAQVELGGSEAFQAMREVLKEAQKNPAVAMGFWDRIRDSMGDGALSSDSFDIKLNAHLMKFLAEAVRSTEATFAEPSSVNNRAAVKMFEVFARFALQAADWSVIPQEVIGTLNDLMSKNVVVLEAARSIVERWGETNLRFLSERMVALNAPKSTDPCVLLQVQAAKSY